jgi:hypothetical protein
VQKRTRRKKKKATKRMTTQGCVCVQRRTRSRRTRRTRRRKKKATKRMKELRNEGKPAQEKKVLL